MDGLLTHIQHNHSILDIHPNDAALPSFHPPTEWPWWQRPPNWQSLLHPPLQPRTPVHLQSDITVSPSGMSPKKHHEITRMTNYIAHLARTRLSKFPPSLRIVDIGAGQGYLTRALHRHFGSPTLALDSDHIQTQGSRTRGSPDGITHRTILISPTTLIHTLDDWIPTTISSSDPTPIPVLFVALHACGSLTPDLFRAVLNLPAKRSWAPVAIVAVGCCYNLMHPPHDFPLAAAHRSIPPLPASAFHLASQIPAHWSDSQTSLNAAVLAIRKVVWRALLGRIFAQFHLDNSSSNTGNTPTMPRLGRLPDAAYASWPTFLASASQRIDVDFSTLAAPEPDHTLEARLENLHVRRCLLGPVVENCIILDRVAWLREGLTARASRPDGEGWSKGCIVEATNLFDQATGSGRNVALVIAPG